MLAVSALNGSNGFRLTGAATGDESGFSVSDAGDVNGDGYADLILGARKANGYAGASYVVFGKSAGFDATMSLSSLTGANGFRITGEVAGDRSGVHLSSAGDVNGDGFDDLIVGAAYADVNFTNAGASYVVFGSSMAFGATVNLSGLTGTNGFQINGAAENDFSGLAVSSAGDVNGDHLADILIGAAFSDANGADSGASFVVFGKTGGFGATMNLSALTGHNGFRLLGAAASDYSGRSVSDAGDINGDSIGDLIIGADITLPPSTIANRSPTCAAVKLANRRAP